jgi:hypothetical protein
MTVKKLLDSDKSDILNLYRQTRETTSTLAERYGVSNSTISRLLKSILPEEEYEALIASKRAARTSGGDATSHSPLFSDPEPDILVAELTLEPKQETVESTPVSSRLRRRSSGVSKPEETPVGTEVQLQLLDTPSVISDIESSSAPPLNQNPASQDLYNDSSAQLRSSASPLNQDADNKPTVRQPKPLDRPVVVSSRSSTLDEVSEAEASTLAEMLGEDLLDNSEELMELEDEDLEDLDEDDLDRDTPLLTRRMPAELLVQVLPLSEATLPKTCYLVIDRASELITRPLREFGDLGQIPTQEDQQKTLPVFDNHRVARRFSTKRDRVIKVPDGRMLKKARSHLQAKGITRLLVDGQVYSLSPDSFPQ